jgi:hypothetical protein
LDESARGQPREQAGSHQRSHNGGQRTKPIAPSGYCHSREFNPFPDNLAGLLYAVVCFGVTMTFNQALNLKLAALSPAQAVVFWPQYLETWMMWKSRAQHGFAAGERAVHTHARVDEIATIVKPNVVYAQQRTLHADELRRVDLVTSGVILAAVMLASTLR